MSPHPYEGLGRAGLTADALVQWLGSDTTASDRDNLRDLVDRHEFARLRDAIETIWKRRAQSRRYHEWRRYDADLARKATQFLTDNLALLSLEADRDFALWFSRWRGSAPPGAPPILQRAWADRRLREAGVAMKADRRLLLKLVATK